MEQILSEIRCPESGKLLLRASWQGTLEIMSPGNRMMFYLKTDGTENKTCPKWQDFASKAVEIRCKRCGRLQCRAVGHDLDIQTKCVSCSMINYYDLRKTHRPAIDSLPNLVKVQRIYELNNF